MTFTFDEGLREEDETEFGFVGKSGLDGSFVSGLEGPVVLDPSDAWFSLRSGSGVSEESQGM